MSEMFEYIFITDRSGSCGRDIVILFNDIVKNLPQNSMFNIVTFPKRERDSVFERSVPLTETNKYTALSYLLKYDGFGGSDLMGAFKVVRKIPLLKGFRRLVITLSDQDVC